jgi:mRNA-degrading endonuclease toxin of MazEF toxin-antitoxin module
MSPRPGEVWLADLGLAAKTRPVVIVSRYDPDSPRALVLYVPLSTRCAACVMGTYTDPEDVSMSGLLGGQYSSEDRQ